MQWKETGVGKVLHEVAERIPKRGLVILISDLFDDPSEVVEALHHFNYRQHELVVFHVLAEEELSFPFQSFQPLWPPRNLRSSGSGAYWPLRGAYSALIRCPQRALTYVIHG